MRVASRTLGSKAVCKQPCSQERYGQEPKDPLHAGTCTVVAIANIRRSALVRSNALEWIASGSFRQP
eukprot:3608365-Alexandrium_andersonii.AAC.1